MEYCRKTTLLLLALVMGVAVHAQKRQDTLYSSNGDTMIVRTILKNGKPDMELLYVQDSLAGINLWHYWNDGYGFSKGLEWRLRENSIIVTKDSIWAYHPNGQLKIVGLEVKGKEHGRVLTYYPSGQQQCDCHYVNGKRDGVQQVYSELGWRSGTYTYVDGVLHGTYAAYYPNGQLRQELMYWEGKPWDAVSAFDPDGHPLPAGTLKEGNGTRYIYDDAGQLTRIETYRKGKRVRKPK
jgi:YD repeat-containing protein